MSTRSDKLNLQINDCLILSFRDRLFRLGLSLRFLNGAAALPFKNIGFLCFRLEDFLFQRYSILLTRFFGLILQRSCWQIAQIKKITPSSLEPNLSSLIPVDSRLFISKSKPFGIFRQIFIYPICRSQFDMIFVYCLFLKEDHPIRHLFLCCLLFIMLILQSLDLILDRLYKDLYLRIGS